MSVHTFSCLDGHTCGNPVRLVSGGAPLLKGATMSERRLDFLAQEFFALQTSVLQPAAEKAASYSRQAYEIVSATGAEIRAAAESTGAEVKAKFGALVENAPGGDKTVALVKSAVAAANTAYETAQKAVKQATEMAEANFEAITKPVVAKSKRAAA